MLILSALLLDDADAAGLAHPVFMFFQFFFGAEDPAEGRAHAGGDPGLFGIAVGIDEGTVVFGMLGHKVDEGLETGAATAGDLDVLRRFEQCLHFAQLCVELHDINLLYTVLEEAVDGGVEILEIVL